MLLLVAYLWAAKVSSDVEELCVPVDRLADFQGSGADKDALAKPGASMAAFARSPSCRVAHDLWIHLFYRSAEKGQPPLRINRARATNAVLNEGRRAQCLPVYGCPIAGILKARRYGSGGLASSLRETGEFVAEAAWLGHHHLKTYPGMRAATASFRLPTSTVLTSLMKVQRQGGVPWLSRTCCNEIPHACKQSRNPWHPDAEEQPSGRNPRHQENE